MRCVRRGVLRALVASDPWTLATAFATEARAAPRCSGATAAPATLAAASRGARAAGTPRCRFSSLALSTRARRRRACRPISTSARTQPTARNPNAPHRGKRSSPQRPEQNRRSCRQGDALSPLKPVSIAEKAISSRGPRLSDRRPCADCRGGGEGPEKLTPISRCRAASVSASKAARDSRAPRRDARADRADAGAPPGGDGRAEPGPRRAGPSAGRHSLRRLP
jgi:hypothetical protein